MDKEQAISEALRRDQRNKPSLAKRQVKIQAASDTTESRALSHHPEGVTHIGGKVPMAIRMQCHAPGFHKTGTAPPQVSKRVAESRTRPV